MFRHALSLRASSTVNMLRPKLRDIGGSDYEASVDDSDEERSNFDSDEPEPPRQATRKSDALEVWFEGTNEDGDGQPYLLLIYLSLTYLFLSP